MTDFLGAVREIESWYDPQHGGALHCPGTFVDSGAMAVICAYAHNMSLSADRIHFPNNSSASGYAKALGLQRALTGVDDYCYERVNQGQNYSPLVHLLSQAYTDEANQIVNSCIRSLLNGLNPEAIAELTAVVGDLHDNVWSHGAESGFSVAQYYPGNNKFTFTLVDHGMGLLQSLKSSPREEVRNVANTDREAIEWCLVKGNSSKLPPEDPWAQRVTEGLNPNLDVAQYSDVGGSHHQGIGLAKCVNYIGKYSGHFTIVSGDAIASINLDGHIAFDRLSSNSNWKGVAINCELNTDRLNQLMDTDTNNSQELESILDILRG